MMFDLRRGAVALWTASLLLGTSASSHAATQPVSTSDLINGIVARSEAIFSMKLDYRYEGTSAASNGDVLSKDERHVVATVQGHDWVMRDAGHANFTMRRNQANFTYTESPKSTGEVDRSLHITAPETFSSLISAHAANAGPRLGTFWFLEQASFVDEHRDHVERLDPQILDGRPTEVLQWKIDASRLGSAMLVIPPQIAAARGGWLRIYVCPSLQYSLLRIEYVAPQGNVEMRIDATDFRKVSSDMRFPFHVTCVSDFQGGQDRSIYQVNTMEFVNEELPAAEFAINVPQGTRVRDSRPGVPTSVFSLTSDDNIAEFQQAIGDLSARPSLSPKLVLQVANVALLLLSILVWSYSRWHSNATS